MLDYYSIIGGKKMIGAKETAERLGIGVGTLRDWVLKGKIKCTFIEEEMWFESEDVNKFIEETGIKLLTPEASMNAVMKKLRLEATEKNGSLIADSHIEMTKFRLEQSKKNKTLNSEEIKELIENLTK